jgi:thiamine biosynthesis lipoprotein
MATTAIAARHTRVLYVMGTVVTLDVRGTPDGVLVDDVFAQVSAWLADVDARFSTYRSDSEINRIQRGQLRAEVASKDVRWVLDRCERLRRETGGAFDARATGRLDPSALVKGWAVQRGADMLQAAGLRDFCLGAGGDLVVRGGALPEPAWRVGIQHPEDRRAVAAVLEVRDLAVATSGAYQRGQHVLDPRTGRPPEGVRSVTVVGQDLGLADAYATAAFAMGRHGAEWTLGLDGYEAMTIADEDVVLCTAGFPLGEGAA